MRANVFQIISTVRGAGSTIEFTATLPNSTADSIRDNLFRFLERNAAGSQYKLSVLIVEKD